MVFEKYSISHKLSLNLMSLNRDCNVLTSNSLNTLDKVKWISVIFFYSGLAVAN